MTENTLYYGDNLAVLRDRDYFPDACVDLIYLDPPFNSTRKYNVLFKERTGTGAEAQIQAFTDTWTWMPSTAQAYDEVAQRGDNVAKLLQAFVGALGHNDVTAYLTMMTPRLVELRRVLKPTGSIYLHCDPTASHYLKALMDAVFGPTMFVNEIVWQRTTAYGDVGQGATHFGRIHDVLLFYVKTDEAKWNAQYTPYEQEYIDKYYKYVDENGRRYWRDNLTAAKPGGDTSYEWKGKRPPPGRYWAYSKANMERMDAQGRIIYSSTGTPMFKRYLDEMPGRPLQDMWNDIRGLGGLGSNASERQGYATQKPLPLLERIIKASSNPGDIVLDPFCGCGTAIHAAHKLGRKWIGIDITYLAIGLVKRRMLDAFPGIQISEVGVPVDLTGAKALAEHDKYQFQWWALDRIDAQPVGEKKKGSDKGIDGVMPFFSGGANKDEYRRAIVSVKGGHVGVSMVRDLVGVLQREKEPVGVLITLEPPTEPMITEAASAGIYSNEFWQGKYPVVQILTIEQILAGQRPQLPPRKAPFAQMPVEREQATQGGLMPSDG